MEEEERQTIKNQSTPHRCSGNTSAYIITVEKLVKKSDGTWYLNHHIEIQVIQWGATLHQHAPRQLGKRVRLGSATAHAEFWDGNL